jgi:hypothetical protein
MAPPIPYQLPPTLFGTTSCSWLPSPEPQNQNQQRSNAEKGSHSNSRRSAVAYSMQISSDKVRASCEQAKGSRASLGGNLKWDWSCMGEQREGQD